jgi:hypothetical protein
MDICYRNRERDFATLVQAYLQSEPVVDQIQEILTTIRRIDARLAKGGGSDAATING